MDTTPLTARQAGSIPLCARIHGAGRSVTDPMMPRSRPEFPAGNRIRL